MLLPTILALGVLFVAASMINSERDRLKDREAGLDVREKSLDIREKDMRASGDAQNARLEAMTVELVRQLRNAASEAKGASAPKSAPASAPNP
ncbi:hypothetical protein [Paraburkholderia sp.]|uniref:hypothetical protein n=1 Tax=Paraburkholderia sp. TaxID=1926495 RepID=UPI003C7BDE72